MSSSSQGKRHRSLNKAWKSFTKLPRAAKKSIATLLSSSPTFRETRVSNPTSSMTNLYRSCSYRCSLCKQLRSSLGTTSRDNLSEERSTVHDGPYVELGNIEDILASVKLVGDDLETGEEEGAQFSKSTWTQTEDFREVDKKSELYIQRFWEDQKIQRQRSNEDFYDMLARGA